jgi:hypothetical protein
MCPDERVIRGEKGLSRELEEPSLESRGLHVESRTGHPG